MTEQAIIREACEATLDSILLAIEDKTRLYYTTWKNKKMQDIVDRFYILQDQAQNTKDK